MGNGIDRLKLLSKEGFLLQGVHGVVVGVGGVSGLGGEIFFIGIVGVILCIGGGGHFFDMWLTL
jgi:hypothetical protein